MTEHHSDLHWLSAAEATRAFAAHTLSPVELVQALLLRIEKLDPKLNVHQEYMLSTSLYHMGDMSVHDIPPPQASLLTARRSGPQRPRRCWRTGSGRWEPAPWEGKSNFGKLRVLHSEYSAVLPTLDTEEEHVESRQSEVKRERPLVRMQNRGRKSLTIGHTANGIGGWAVHESLTLLERLMQGSRQPDFVYSHEWEVVDLVIWNNTETLLRVISCDRNSGRIMRRPSLAGVGAIT